MQHSRALQGLVPDESRTLFAGQLPEGITESALLEAFAFEQLVSVEIAKDAQSASLGYGSLTFATRQAAQNFLASFNGRNIGGTLPLKLRWASQESARQMSPLTGGQSDVPDTHSLFVGDLLPEVTDVQLQQHFQTYFPSATSAKIITDRLSGLSKGYGFIRFTSAEERDQALSFMHGQKIGGQTIRVNRAKANKYKGDGMFYPSDYDINNTTAFVGNVNTDITEEDLWSVFKRCGEILSVKLLKAKGCAFITYANRDAAERAINHLHGRVIKNSAVRLCWGRRNIYNSYPLPPPLLAAAPQQPMLGQMPHPTLQAYTQQIGHPAYTGQAFLPQQHYSAPPLHPAQGFPGQNALPYQPQPYWRPDIPQDLQGQQYGAQLGLGQGLVAQQFLPQNPQTFAMGPSLPSQVNQPSYPASSITVASAGGATPAAAQTESRGGYRAPASASLNTRLAARPGARPTRRNLLTETEDVLAQLSLGGGPARSSFS